jgi:hypothetical protein
VTAYGLQESAQIPHSHVLDIAAADAAQPFRFLSTSSRNARRLYCCAATPLCSVCHQELWRYGSVGLETANDCNVQPSLVHDHGSQTSRDTARNTSAWASDCTVLIVYSWRCTYPTGSGHNYIHVLIVYVITNHPFLRVYLRILSIIYKIDPRLVDREDIKGSVPSHRKHSSQGTSLYRKQHRR